MFESTSTREESFALGPMSRLIAGELANHPQAKNRRKTAPNKASIVFIDRTLDLTGACHSLVQFLMSINMSTCSRVKHTCTLSPHLNDIILLHLPNRKGILLCHFRSPYSIPLTQEFMFTWTILLVLHFSMFVLVLRGCWSPW